MLYIHVGLQKTATSYLQQKIFNSLDGICYLGIDNVNNKTYEMLKKITLQNCLEYEKDEINNYFKEIIDIDKNYLISYEAFSSIDRVDRIIMINRIKEIFGDVKIIITIREQEKFIKSYYSQLKKNKLFKKRFYNINYWIESYSQNKEINSDFNNPLKILDYHILIKKYKEIFGESNVHILIYEQFIQDKKTFLSNLLKKLNIFEINEDKIDIFRKDKTLINQSQPDIIIILFRNKTFRYIATLIPEYIKKSIRKYLLKSQTTNELNVKNRLLVRNISKETNIKLVDDYQLNLKEFNYQL